MPCDAKLEKRTCFDYFMLGREQELDELSVVCSPGLGWRGREMNKEQKERVRHSWRVNRNYWKGSSEVLFAWITNIKGGLEEQSALACGERWLDCRGRDLGRSQEYLAATEELTKHSPSL